MENIKFWLEDITILFKNDSYLNYYPTHKSSRIEQLNSITRLSIYSIILMLLFGYDSKYLYIPITLITGTIIIYYLYKNDVDKEKKDLNRTNKIDIGYESSNIDNTKRLSSGDKDTDDINNIINKGSNNIINEFDTIYNNSSQNNNEVINPTNEFSTDMIRNEIGNMDISKINLSKNDITKINESTINNKLEEFKLKSRKSTINNPFMNPTIENYNNGPVEVHSDTFNKDIQNQININFEHNLFLDFEDTFRTRNSQRQFYTVPNRKIPNDQKIFAEWLYKVDKTCKEDQSACFPEPLHNFGSRSLLNIY